MKPIGYMNGRWLPLEEMAVAVDDAGFFQGVTAVERLRSWQGRLPLFESHLLRFQHTTGWLRIEGLPRPDELRTLVDELISRNPSSADVGIVWFATPGRRAARTEGGRAQPTLGLHLSPLDFPRLERLRRDGQPLVVTEVRQPSPQCWPRTIKVRSRIHYYMADHIARQSDSDALGVLLDDDGTITETSVANIAIVRGRRLIIPPAERILPGVMLGLVCELAGREGIEVHRQPISVDALRTADEVLLTGTEAGVWPARRVDDMVKQPGPVCRALQRALQRRLAPDEPQQESIAPR